MIPLLALLALLFFAWRGAGAVSLALLVAGFAGSFLLSIRMLRASVGGVGGHAEWVRDVSLRPRLGSSPAWGISLLLVVGGILSALAGC